MGDNLTGKIDHNDQLYLPANAHYRRPSVRGGIPRCGSCMKVEWRLEYGTAYGWVLRVEGAKGQRVFAPDSKCVCQ